MLQLDAAEGHKMCMAMMTQTTYALFSERNFKMELASSFRLTKEKQPRKESDIKFLWLHLINSLDSKEKCYKVKVCILQGEDCDITAKDTIARSDFCRAFGWLNDPHFASLLRNQHPSQRLSVRLALILCNLVAPRQPRIEGTCAGSFHHIVLF